MIHYIRDLAYSELSADFDKVKESFSEMSDDVRHFRTRFNALTKGSAGMTNSLGPLFGIAYRRA